MGGHEPADESPRAAREAPAAPEAPAAGGKPTSEPPSVLGPAGTPRGPGPADAQGPEAPKSGVTPSTSPSTTSSTGGEILPPPPAREPPPAETPAAAPAASGRDAAPTPIPAAPKPCTMRATVRSSSVCASAQNSDASVNSNSPGRYTRR